MYFFTNGWCTLIRINEHVIYSKCWQQMPCSVVLTEERASKINRIMYPVAIDRHVFIDKAKTELREI